LATMLAFLCLLRSHAASVGTSTAISAAARPFAFKRGTAFQLRHDRGGRGGCNRRPGSPPLGTRPSQAAHNHRAPGGGSASSRGGSFSKGSISRRNSSGCNKDGGGSRGGDGSGGGSTPLTPPPRGSNCSS